MSIMPVLFDVRVEHDQARNQAPIEAKRRNINACMVFVKANKDSEAGILPARASRQHGKFNEELVKAGVMLAAKA